MAFLLNHPPLFAIALILLLALAVEIGFRLALVSGLIEDEIRHEHISSTRDALGVLLSLLLGFTLAMALPRYDLRRELVLDEANAIGTLSLRAQLLPQPFRATVRPLLLDYTRARIAFSLSGGSTDQIREPLARSKDLQTRLWAQAAAAAQASPTPVTTLFIQALNDVIDLSEKRTAALENRIPPTIWLMLVIIAVLTCLMFGYATRRRFWVVLVITPLMTAVVMGLIADLDSPRNGFIQTDLRSLQRTELELEAETNQTPAAAPAAPNNTLPAPSTKPR